MTTPTGWQPSGSMILVDANHLFVAWHRYTGIVASLQFPGSKCPLAIVLGHMEIAVPSWRGEGNRPSWTLHAKRGAA